MKLYYSPGSCAMSPHIVLAEAGVSYELDRVDLSTKTTQDGGQLKDVHEQDAVPVLLLDDGDTLTEGAAIVQFIADRNPASGLAPAAGTIERARVQEWLNYIATEMHKAHVPLFKADYAQEAKQIALTNVKKAYDYVSRKLGDKAYLTGDTFTVADAYLFTIINWHNFINVDLSPWPVLADYQARVAARPAVQAALREEGLLESIAA